MQNLNKFKELEDSDIYQVASWFEKQKSVYAINGQVFFFFGWLETAKSDQRFFQAHCEKIAQLIHVIFKQMLNHISELCCPDQKCFFGSWNYNMNKDNM